MARIKMDEVVGHLGSETRAALAEAVRRAIPEARFDHDALFYAFRRELGRKCKTWERVPDEYVRD